MKNKAFFLVVLIFLGVVLSCDAWVGMKGRVVDEYNNPIENATVQVSMAGGSDDSWKDVVKTDKDGKFDLHIGVAGWRDTNLRVIVAKDSYKIFNTDINASHIQKNPDEFMNYQIVLKKLD